MTESLDRNEALETELTGVDADGDVCRASLTEDQRKTLSARMLVDAEFRKHLLRDPRAAAARMGIVLGDWECEEILKYASQIRSVGKRADGILSQPGVKAGVLPFFIMD